MASHRNERINGQIQRELSLIILHKMKDPRILSSSLSITRVKATPDLKIATVYVSILGSSEEKEDVLSLLNNAKSFLRSNLGQVIKVHSIPALSFELDNSVEYGMHIDAILKEIKQGKKLKDDDENNS